MILASYRLNSANMTIPPEPVAGSPQNRSDCETQWIHWDCNPSKRYHRYVEETSSRGLASKVGDGLVNLRLCLAHWHTHDAGLQSLDFVVSDNAQEDPTLALLRCPHAAFAEAFHYRL